MWHASVGRLGTQDAREELARRVLDGCGDASLGEWVEPGLLALHVRRRLTQEEAEAVGPVLDIRGTADAEARMRVMRLYLPPSFRYADPF